MEHFETDMIHIHQEFIQREASLHLALEQSGLLEPPLFRRFLPALGDAMCRIGTHLKEGSGRKLSADEASAPTYMIML
jgi:hypothetical protein